jgi:hypothetical protein
MVKMKRRIKKYQTAGDNNPPSSDLEKLVRSIMEEYKIDPKNKIPGVSQTEAPDGALLKYNFDNSLNRQSRRQGGPEFDNLLYYGNDKNTGSDIFSYDVTTTTKGDYGSGNIGQAVDAISPLIDATTFTANSITDMKNRKQNMNKRYELARTNSQYSQNESGLNNIPAYFKKGGKNKKEPQADETNFYDWKRPGNVNKGTWQYEVGKMPNATEGSFGQQLNMLQDMYGISENDAGFRGLVNAQTFAGTDYAKDPYAPVMTADAQGNQKYRPVTRTIDFHNADEDIQEYIRQSTAARLGTNSNTTGFSKVGEYSNGQPIDMSQFDLSNQYYLRDYAENPDYNMPDLSAGMPLDGITDRYQPIDIPLHRPKVPIKQRVPVPRKPTTPEKTASPMNVDNGLMPPNLPTRDNTLNRGSDLYAPDGSLIPKELLAMGKYKNDPSTYNTEIMKPVYDEKTGEVIDMKPTKVWNGQYKQDRLNWGDDSAPWRDKDSEGMAVDIALLIATGGIMSGLARLSAAGIRGAEAANLMQKAKSIKLSKKVIDNYSKMSKGSKVWKSGINELKKLPSEIKNIAPKVPIKQIGNGRIIPTPTPIGNLPIANPQKGQWILDRLGVSGYQQGGHNIGDTIDVSPDDIAYLIEQGYDFEID